MCPKRRVGLSPGMSRLATKSLSSALSSFSLKNSSPGAPKNKSMLQAIVQFSLRFRGVVLALAIVIVGYGIYVAAHAKLDVFPDFVQPQVVVQTEAPGLSPEQVESLVTRPVEAALNGLVGLESMRSESIQGLSIITVIFKEGTDIFIERQMLGEKLGQTAGQLPLSVKAPRMTPLTSATMDL